MSFGAEPAGGIDLTEARSRSTLALMGIQAFLTRQRVKRLLLTPMPFWRGQAVALTCSLVALALREAIAPLVGYGVPFLTFFPAVVVASVVAGPLAGVSALVMSTALAEMLVLPLEVDLAPGATARAIAFWLLCLLLIAITALLRALAQALAASEEQAHVLARESAHRARNVLGLVQAMARQSSRSAADLPSFLTLLEARLVALARAQELLFGSQADMRVFLERIVEPFGRDRFALSGPPAAIAEEHGVSLALVVHELATNALKYGALSAASGQVAISWEKAPGALRLTWRETGGPPVAPPAQQGFGARLLASAFRPERGAASVAFEPTGLVCRIEIQVDRRDG